MFNYPYFGMPFYNRYSRYGYRYPYTYSNRNNYQKETKQATKSYSKSNSYEKKNCSNVDSVHFFY